MRETEFLVKTITIAGKQLTINIDTLGFTVIVIVVILGLCLWLRRGLQIMPTKRQVALEALIGFFDDILQESMGPQGKKFLGFIVSLFLFILVSNWLGIIPKFLPPTRDLNVCLGLAIVVLIIAHVNAIKVKGLRKYVVTYFRPYWWLFPSNVFSEISKALSHSFRLFGNIFAGGIVVALIPTLILNLMRYWGIPLVIAVSPVVKAFFGLFMGGIQAYVFTVLAVAYISVLAAE